MFNKNNEITRLIQDVKHLKNNVITEDKLRERVKVIVSALSEANSEMVDSSAFIKQHVNSIVNETVNEKLRKVVDKAVKSEVINTEPQMTQSIRQTLEREFSFIKEHVNEYKTDLTEKLNHDLGQHIDHCPGKVNVNLRSDLDEKINSVHTELLELINSKTSSLENKIVEKIDETKEKYDDDILVIIQNEINKYIKEDIKISPQPFNDNIVDKFGGNISIGTFVSVMSFVLAIAGSVYFYFYSTDQHGKDIVTLREEVKGLKKQVILLEKEGIKKDLVLKVDANTETTKRFNKFEKEFIQLNVEDRIGDSKQKEQELRQQIKENQSAIQGIYNLLSRKK